MTFPEIKALPNVGKPIRFRARQDSVHQGVIRSELTLGRRELSSSFQSSTLRTLASNRWLANSDAPSSAIYHIRSGWACEYRDLAGGGRALVDVYLPGDVIALDAVLRTRRPEAVLTLTSVTAEVIDTERALIDLLASPSIALYITWLLGQRQRRADELIASLLCLDARGRLAKMFLGFYTRLLRKKLITGQTYILPLTQVQIGSYVGLTVVHVNRVLGWLRDERIAQLEKHCVTILDFKQLKSLAQQERFEDSTERMVGHPLEEGDFGTSEPAE